MLNNVTLMGRIVNDIELRHTQNGVANTSFRIAVDRNYTPKGQEKQTDFINIVVWRNSAEFVSKYFNKGQMIALEGSIQTRQYTDKNGNNRTAFEVVADQVYFAGDKKDNGTAPAYAQQKGTDTTDPSDFEEIDTDEEILPF